LTRYGFFELVRGDISSFAELKGVNPRTPSGLIDVLLFPGMMAVLLFRVSGFFHHRGVRPLSRLLYILNLILFGVDLAPGAEVGPGLALPHPVGVAIAPATRIGRRVRLFQQVSVGGGSYEARELDGFPTVGDRCWIFAGAKVLGPVHLGDDSMVAANALVIRSVPAQAVVVGNPARVVRYRSSLPTSGARTAADAQAVVDAATAEDPS